MNKLKALSGWIVALLLAVFAVGGLALAASTFSWNHVEDKVAANLTDKVSSASDTGNADDQSFGAVTSPDITSPYISVNGVVTYNLVQSFQAGTTTIISMPDPFLQATSTGDTSSIVIKTDAGGRAYTGATSTVDLMRLNITGPATSSFRLACGASASPTGVLGTALARTIVSSTPALAGDSFATGTVGMIENNVTTGQGGLLNIGTTAKIILDPGLPYLVCTVGAVDNTAFTNPQSTFAGKGTAKISKTRF